MYVPICPGTFPGDDVKVVYDGWTATPEELGNYTYARIGRALGFSLPDLIMGSWVAAGIPLYGKALENEFNDWPAIKKGFDSYN